MQITDKFGNNNGFNNLVIIDKYGKIKQIPSGGGSSSNILSGTAGENISGGTVVIIKNDALIYKYDITSEIDYGLTVGISKTAALATESIDIYISGIATEVGSGWSAGEIYYISATSLPTTIFPTTGTVKIIGVGYSVDQILINNNLEIIQA